MSIFPAERPAHYKVQRQGCAALWSPPVHSLVEKGDSNDWKCLRSVGEERWVTFSSHSCSFCWLGWIFFTSWQSLWSFPVSSKVKRSEHLQSFPTRAMFFSKGIHILYRVFCFRLIFAMCFFSSPFLVNFQPNQTSLHLLGGFTCQVWQPTTRRHKLVPSKPMPWEPSVVPWPPSWSGNPRKWIRGWLVDPMGT